MCVGERFRTAVLGRSCQRCWFLARGIKSGPCWCLPPNPEPGTTSMDEMAVDQWRYRRRGDVGRDDWDHRSLN